MEVCILRGELFNISGFSCHVISDARIINSLLARNGQISSGNMKIFLFAAVLLLGTPFEAVAQVGIEDGIDSMKSVESALDGQSGRNLGSDVYPFVPKPTSKPTNTPNVYTSPTQKPTSLPTNRPTPPIYLPPVSPPPTTRPTMPPTPAPTSLPTSAPTAKPTLAPTATPVCSFSVSKF